MTVDGDTTPKRADDLEINQVPDGYIVYQPSRDRVHYLNHTAVLVLELCTGRVRAGDMAQLLRNAYDLPEAPTEEVASCLNTLSSEGLIQ